MKDSNEKKEKRIGETTNALDRYPLLLKPLGKPQGNRQEGGSL
ncbi:MAG: hypothetical protein ACI4Q0_03865 [Oligosphaeraceae bacterium]